MKVNLWNADDVQRAIKFCGTFSSIITQKYHL